MATAVSLSARFQMHFLIEPIKSLSLACSAFSTDNSLTTRERVGSTLVFGAALAIHVLSAWRRYDVAIATK